MDRIRDAAAPDPEDHVARTDSHVVKPTGTDPVRRFLDGLDAAESEPVPVHIDSPSAEAMGALAYTDGTAIHLAPGAPAPTTSAGEQILGHELAHIDQQRATRIRLNTRAADGTPVADYPHLEAAAKRPAPRIMRASWTLASGATAASSGQGVVQPMWATVDGTGERLNLRHLDGDTYEDAKTGKKYVVTSRASNGDITVAPDAGGPAAPGGNINTVYNAWQPGQGTAPVTTPWGDVSARHNRGAPYVQSQAANYGGAALGDTYAAYIDGLRSGGQDDTEIAEILLTSTAGGLDQLQSRAAAMLTATVYLSERWRKQGAAKIYRAMLRCIAAGTHTFDDFLADFKFIESADAGRKMVARFQDFFNDNADDDEFEGDEADYYAEQSEIERADYSSDDERDKKKLGKRRLHASHHKKTKK